MGAGKFHDAGGSEELSVSQQEWNWRMGLFLGNFM